MAEQIRRVRIYGGFGGRLLSGRVHAVDRATASGKRPRHHRGRHLDARHSHRRLLHEGPRCGASQPGIKVRSDLYFR